MMTNSELLASLHKRFGIGSNKSSVDNDEAIAFGTVIQGDNNTAEEEDSDDDSDYIDNHKEEKTHEHIAGKSKSVMDDDDDDDSSSLEVTDVVVGCDDNVSLHTQPSQEQVSIENTDDIDVDDVDVDDSNQTVTHSKCLEGGKVKENLEWGRVKEKQQLRLSCSVGLKKSSGTRRKLETISPREFSNWSRMHLRKTGRIFYVDTKGFVWPCAGCNPIGRKQMTHTPYCPHAKRMKSRESRFRNNLDPLREYFDEPEWDPMLPTTFHDIPDGEYVRCPIVLDAKRRLRKAKQMVKKSMKKRKKMIMQSSLQMLHSPSTEKQLVDM